MPFSHASLKSDYLGIVIEQSLQDKNIAAPAKIVASKILNTWVFLLVSVAATALNEHIGKLQAKMVTGGKWYAHYFRGVELIVVFRDAVFKVSIDPGTWGPVIKYGLKKGVPREQLDFKPATLQDAVEFFGISKGSLKLSDT